MSETVPASDIHPDVLELCQKISDAANELVLQVESMDGNQWLASADKIDSLNNQLQAMLVAKPATTKKGSN